MEPAGWIVMCTSITVVFSLVSWCYYRVLTLPPIKPGEKL